LADVADDFEAVAIWQSNIRENQGGVIALEKQKRRPFVSGKKTGETRAAKYACTGIRQLGFVVNDKDCIWHLLS